MRLFQAALLFSLLLAVSVTVTAQATKDVNVANTPNVNVVNNPGVQVTNTPSVNVTNTPNVNVASLPAAQVTNTVNGDGSPAPLVTRDAENGIRSPFRKRGNMTIDAGFGGITNSFLIPVPAGTRVGLEFVAVKCSQPTASGVSITDIAVTTGENLGGGSATTHSYALPVHANTPDAFGNTGFVASGPVKLYADGGAFGIGLSITTSAPSAAGACNLEVSGSQISVP